LRAEVPTPSITMGEVVRGESGDDNETGRDGGRAWLSIWSGSGL